MISWQKNQVCSLPKKIYANYTDFSVLMAKLFEWENTDSNILYTLVDVKYNIVTFLDLIDIYSNKNCTI